MQTRDKISKAVWNFCEMCKDNIKLKIADEISSKRVVLSREQVNVLLTVVCAAIDQVFHRAVTSVTNVVPVDEASKLSEAPTSKSFTMKKPGS